KGIAFACLLLVDLEQPVDPHSGDVRRRCPDRPEIERGPQRELLGSQRVDHFAESVVRDPPSVIELHEILHVRLHVFTVLFPLPAFDLVAAGSVRYRWRVGPIQAATRVAGAAASGSTLTT